MKLSDKRKYISTQSKIQLWISLLSSVVETKSVSRFNMWLSNLVISLSSSIKYKEANTTSQSGKMAEKHHPVYMFVLKTPSYCCCVHIALDIPSVTSFCLGVFLFKHSTQLYQFSTGNSVLLLLLCGL